MARLCVLGLLLVMWSNLLFAQQLQFKTEIWSPFQFYVDGQLTGISVDIVQEIQVRLGSDWPVVVTPWIRGFKLAQHRDDSALFSMFRTPEREPLFRWVGPLAELTFYFYKKVGAPITVASLEDAREVKRIGVTRFSGNESLMRGLGFGNLSVRDSGEHRKNVEMLLKGRLDLWVTDSATAAEFVNASASEGRIEPLLDVPIQKVGIFIAFGPGSSDQLVTDWQDCLEDMRSDGSLEAIYRRYGVEQK